MVYGVFAMRRQLTAIWMAMWIGLLAAGVGLGAPGALGGPYLDYANSLNRSPPQGAKYRPDLEEELVRLANAYRAAEGRKPLVPGGQFRAAARAHAADMMGHGFMGHKASTGHDFDSRMRVFVDDITRFPALAENAARDTQKTPIGAAKARALFKQWINSRPHRKALTSRDYQFVSTGVIQRGTSIWAVQIFFAAPRQKGMFQ